ncbi:TRAP transporter small permease [Salisediminibacterium halotolerans]|uniref:C4-dicarboxylate transporter, DctQ subunit n=1 Tax=Salisediminibacterium halotolerans TaxID=517425 RepID=A0A1H9QMR5_9BACI|nr:MULTISPECIES: TRAP transporter small permease [Salisediminibacterium]RLJ75758.1 C4-dicarboxylate transporter DctQ subunit [Actinophytocola xinjiangensis]RPE89612.1 C4-dicarboxylate transporter DctQ subunit [Salisediminibacterium halotolerans]TWG36371.1 C4-dicarboxylate transporter DctQ subunit [Salisediminibacterium halotolerans]SER61033.1 C4-dicarboxylate transporter, DctQ subunit [Salisediminibacterium haloalkalitolerans]GEL08891.1 hypothetical protein SHA02_23070 [Salisediminibacterium h
MTVLRNGVKVLYKIEEIVIAALIMIATVVLFSNVVLRYGFAANTSWAAELIRYLMIWITFIGMGLCYRRGIHVGIDFMLNYLPKKTKKALQLTVNALSVVFLGFLGYYGWELVQFSYGTNQITPSLEIGIYWVYAIIPIGSALSIFHIIVLSIEMIKSGEELELNRMSEEP